MLYTRMVGKLHCSLPTLLRFYSTYIHGAGFPLLSLPQECNKTVFINEEMNRSKHLARLNKIVVQLDEDIIKDSLYLKKRLSIDLCAICHYIKRQIACFMVFLFLYM